MTCVAVTVDAAIASGDTGVAVSVGSGDFADAADVVDTDDVAMLMLLLVWFLLLLLLLVFG